MNNIKVFLKEEFSLLGSQAQNILSSENIKYTINDALEPLSTYRDPNGRLLRTITKKRSIILSGESNISLSIGINIIVTIEGSWATNDISIRSKTRPQASTEFEGFAIIEKQSVCQMEMIVTEVKTICTQAKILWFIEMEEL